MCWRGLTADPAFGTHPSHSLPQQCHGSSTAHRGIWGSESCPSSRRAAPSRAGMVEGGSDAIPSASSPRGICPPSVRQTSPRRGTGQWGPAPEAASTLPARCQATNKSTKQRRLVRRRAATRRAERQQRRLPSAAAAGQAGSAQLSQPHPAPHWSRWSALVSRALEALSTARGQRNAEGATSVHVRDDPRRLPACEQNHAQNGAHQ